MTIKERTKQWLSGVLKSSSFKVEDIPLSGSSEWSCRDGAIRHRSGRFFSVTGVSWDDGATTRQQPMIDQREVGTLAFALRTKNGEKELLAFAKLEPGNIGPVQIAPTCQATASNIAMAHGGENPPFAEMFSASALNILSDSLQSEQGSRFFGKRNRNMMIEAGPEIDEGPLHKWIKVKDLLGLLNEDFLVNTDARSVLVTSPWKELCHGDPFRSNREGFGADLQISMNNNGAHGLAEAIKNIVDMRAAAGQPKIMNVKDVNGWDFDTNNPETLRGKEFSVRHIKVRALTREVENWDQPIIDSHGEGQIELVCGRVNGILNFAFKPQVEPGLVNRAELGPTFVLEAVCRARRIAKDYEGRVVAETSQSEEGGRFYRDKNLYRIIDIGEADEELEECFWLSLRDIQKLLLEGNWFTNEARSVLSLLLKWL